MTANMTTIEMAGELMELRDKTTKALFQMHGAKKNVDKVIRNEGFELWTTENQVLALREQVRLNRLIRELNKLLVTLNEETETFTRMVEVREEE